MDGRERAAIDSAIAELWREFKETGEERLRERLILHYSPLVKYVAGRVGVGLPPNIEQADLVSYGIFGLIDAIEKFDLERAIKFETYAISRIKGAIIDELRAIDWIPRSVRYKAREVEKAYAALEAGCTARPTEAEVAAELGIALEDLHTIFSQVSFVNVVALDELLTSAARRATSSRSSTPSRTPRPRTRSRRSRARRRSTCSPRRSTRCPSARRSS
jgi:RNA polymerase sigma factor for flagellar operon FliA